MKTLMITLFGILSAFAQDKTVTTTSYDKISVSGPYTVKLVSGTEGKIGISGSAEALERLSIEVQNGVLMIGPDKKSQRNWKGSATITVPVESVDEITLSGSGKIITDFTLKAETIVLRTGGSGRIEAKVDAKLVTATHSGSGSIEISGRADSFKASLSGSGEITASDLQTQTADANVSGSGSIALNCRQSVVARVAGSGRIDYSGNPEKEDTKVTGSGRIRKS